MPEGDTLHRLANRLGPTLIGRTVVRLALPRTTVRTEGMAGTTITGVEARGKNLLVHFDNALSLHTHLRMNGGWRVVRAPVSDDIDGLVVVIDVGDVAAICLRAPVARLLRTKDIGKDLAFRDLGPDLLGETFDEDDAIRRLRARDHTTLAEALLDQSAVAGIGNVWKSELCFNRKLDPFAPPAAVTDEELRVLLALARKQLRENVDAPRRRLPDPFTPRGPSRFARQNRRAGEKVLSIYERAGEPCYDCGTKIEMVRHGVTPRSTYWCPTCQPSRRP